MRFCKQNKDTSQNEENGCSRVVTLVITKFNRMYFKIQTDTIKFSIDQRQRIILFDNKLKSF